MAFSLKSVVCSVSAEGGEFQSESDREFSEELYTRHSLQSMLEEASGLTGKSVPESVKKLTPKYLSVLTVLIKKAPVEWISTFIYGFSHPETFSLCLKCVRTISRIAGDFFKKI